MKLALVYCVVVCFITNVLFYGIKYGVSLPMLSYSLQNILASFALSSKLGLSDVIGLSSMLAEQEGLPALLRSQGFSTVLVNGYAISTILAPLCTVSAMLMTVELFLRKLFLRARAVVPGSTLIFGYTDSVKELVKKAQNLTIISEESLDAPALRELEKRKICYHEMDAKDEDNLEVLKKLHPEQASRVLLMGPDDFANLTIYMKLMESGIPFSEDCLMAAECQEPLARQLFKDYYNEKRCTPVQLFTQEEMAAESVIQQYPPEEYLSEESHILIAGIGKVGNAVLDRLLNDAVIDASSKLRIDIIDKDAKKFREGFASGFSAAYGTVTDQSIHYCNPDLDGELEFRFYSMDLTGCAFAEFIKKCEYRYEYAVICLADPQTGIDTVLKLNNITKTYGKDGFPILLVQDPTSETTKYLHMNDAQYQNIHYVETVGSLDAIFRGEEDKRARTFNEIYNSLTIMNEADYVPGQQEAVAAPWNTMDYYKQLSSRKAANHQRIKEFALRKKYGENFMELLEERFGENGTILKKRGSCYLTTCATDEELVARINADPLAREMAMLEHKRWNISMAADGWSYAKKKNIATKETPYIVDWDTLCRTCPWACVYDLMPLLYFLSEEEKSEADAK